MMPEVGRVCTGLRSHVNVSGPFRGQGEVCGVFQEAWRIELHSGCREGADLRGSEQVVDQLGDSQGSRGEARTRTGVEGEGASVWGDRRAGGGPFCSSC